MPTLALMYHRVNTLRPDPWTICVSPRHFEEHLQVIRGLSADVAITFDDGYADNFQNAQPLLEKYETPATVFVTSGLVGSSYEMWWDELERKYLRDTPAKWDWDDADPDDGATSYRREFRRYREEPFAIFDVQPKARPDRRMMMSQEVAQLARGGLITIGAHTVTHPVLSRLPPESQYEEIARSKQTLEEVTGMEVRLFAYPNGGKQDYTEETVRLVRSAGFHGAYAAWDAPLTEPVDQFQMPRVMVRDWNGDVFASVLRKKLSA